MKVLDVGCGSHKRGEVGVDVEPFAGVDYVVDLDKSPLPFPDNSFDTVCSHHFLEHLQHPELAVREMVRVAKTNIIIIVPHRFSSYAKMKCHKSFLSKKWFLDVAKKLPVDANVKSTFEPLIYFGFGIFSRPYELHVDFRKLTK